MKKLLMLAFVGFMLNTTQSFAQLNTTLQNLEKGVSTAASTVGSTTTSSVLGSLDKSLMAKYGLDAVKSSLVGNILNIKIGDTDLSKLTTAQRTKQATDVYNSAKTMLSGNNGINLSSLGVKNVVVDMFKNLTLKDLLSSSKFTL